MNLRSLTATATVVVLSTAAAACTGAAALSSVPGGRPEQGAAHIRSYGCGSCHTIPGIAGARGLVGPPLEAMAERSYIAGVLTNTPQHMVAWIRDPKAIDERTAMPRLGITDQEAQDIAAYLFTLRRDDALGRLRRLATGRP